MEFVAETIVSHPPKAAYECYRDHLPELVADVPNVERIEVLKRTGVRGGVKLHNLWHAHARIPRIAQTVISPDLLRWDDYAHWRDRTRTCDWELSARADPERFECVGHHSFESDGPNETCIRIEGDLYLNRGGPLRSQIEKWITALMVKNLEQINAALDRYLS